MSAFDPKRTLKAASLPHLHGGFGPSGNFSPSASGSEFPAPSAARIVTMLDRSHVVGHLCRRRSLPFDISDEALEIAAGTVSDKANFTWGYCTANQGGCPG